MDVKDLVQQFESFQNYTIEARALSERDQDYDDHHQWTEAEVETLESRNQAAVVINRVKVKVNLLTGIQKKTRTKPKALPRTPQHEMGADAVTEALRYICDNTDFDMKSSAVFRDQAVPGYGGAIVEYVDEEIVVNKIPWDRYYYDPHSRELDFSDKNYDGIIIWMDRADAIAEFPDKEKDIDALVKSSTGDETFDDKPLHWVDEKRDRIRIAQHFFKEKGVWKMAYFTESLFLKEPQDSPYKDEDGKPENPIEMQTAYIDRELRRYGEVRSYIWLQDEINHRRSRLLYAGSVNRTIGQKGAVDDVNEMKSELAKANGHIVYNKGFDFEVLPNDSISETQLLLYRESKAEIDEVSANFSAGVTGETSGRARQIQQQGTIAELASLYDGHKHWEKRIYRQMWNRVKQFWSKEKWIRVTDDESNLEWVGLNTPVTNGELMLQAAQESPKAAQLLQKMTLAGDPRLHEVAETRNNVAELDIDIILTESPDFVTIRQEQFEILASLAERYGPDKVPFEAMLKLSDMPNKDEVKKALQPEIDPEAAQRQAEIEELMLKLDIGAKEADIVAKKAKAQKDTIDAEAQQIENAVVQSGFENLVADRNTDSRMKQTEALQKEIETIKLAQEPTDSVNVNV